MKKESTIDKSNKNSLGRRFDFFFFSVFAASACGYLPVPSTHGSTILFGRLTAVFVISLRGPIIFPRVVRSILF